MRSYLPSVLAAVLGFISTVETAHAGACLNPFGCKPSTYDECRADAATKPTDAGVRVAMSMCYEVFKKPEEEKKAAEKAAAAEKFAASWGTIKYGTAVAAIKRRLGEPAVVRSSTCTKFSDRAMPPRCTVLMWKDERPGRICPGNFGDIDCYFRLEVAEGDGYGERIWTYWEQSFEK